MPEGECATKISKCTEEQDCCGGTCCDNGCNEAGDDCAETEITEADLCDGVICPEGQVCNPETGNCVCGEGKISCSSGENACCDSELEACCGGKCCPGGCNAAGNDCLCEGDTVGVRNYGSGPQVVCCPVSADNPGATMWDVSEMDYQVAGAVDGKCCGGYTRIGYLNTENFETIDWEELNYDVKLNGGEYYCARWGKYIYGLTDYYVGSNQYCYSNTPDQSDLDCVCSSVGNPLSFQNIVPCP